MSGPATAAYSLESLAIVLVAEALREAHAMGLEYEAVLAETQARERQRLSLRQQARAAEGERLAALQGRVETLERRLGRLAGLLEQAPELPLAPRGAELSAWSAHVRALEALLQELETQVAAQAGQAVRQALEAVAATPDLDNILALYLARRQALRGEADQAAWRATVERVLARLELPAGMPVPAELEVLAREVILAETPARAELLANELRLQVHLQRQAQAEARAEAEQAAAWLEQLPEAALPESLRALLAEVAAGLVRLDPETRQQLQTLSGACAAEQARREAEAAAIVLEHSLQDLGYQVEAVSETLFVEGGMLHFQRPGWEGYYVRLRANVKEKTFNFNVVRARQESAAEEESAVRKRLDFMAEERWCAEFPRLLDTLAARGLKLDVTRRLEAGELPVQAVAPESLPRFEEGERARPWTAPRTMDLPGKS
ncbi:hypothetical protein [Azovibrio restrictus]|uniref:hypothetical protein n=1 Tax=Azovibrio restrictus TaxID=146938 RepID=UPI0026EAAC86|nr:hypothetical protein [Azovibrio restrictus]MDD3482639.1 hypothetical protein [Azovibrio restrictus]